LDKLPSEVKLVKKVIKSKSSWMPFGKENLFQFQAT
jgi:hypothetical protein